MPPPVVYLDTCALNRLTDTLDQPRLVSEASAMATIITLIQTQQVQWVASVELLAEIDRNPNPYKRVRALSLLPPHDQIIFPSDFTTTRAVQIEQSGLAPGDAMHLALAEQAHADWFITTDDRLLRRSASRTQLPECINPVDWLRRRKLWLVPKP